MKIRTKIIGMGLMLVLMTALSIVGISIEQVHELDTAISDELERYIHSETRKVAENVYLMCRSVQQHQDEELDRNMRVARKLLRDRGGLSFGRDTVFWRALNQFDQSVSEVRLPKALVGGQWLGKNTGIQHRAPVVDAVQDMLGVTCTIFQRMNEDGDMLRVATNILNDEGLRAIGTFIPHTNPDGSSNQVIDALLSGKPYVGNSFVVNDWYVTRYEPLMDPSGEKVVGAVYVGYKQESLSGLRNGILDITVGKTGYVYVLGSRGSQRGKMLISPLDHLQGMHLLNDGDRQTQLIVRRLLQKASQLSVREKQPQPVAFEQYLWRSSPDEDYREKLVALTYFEPWDWIIVAGAYKDDYVDIQTRFVDSLSQATIWISVVALGIVLFSLLVGFYVAGGIVRPLEKAIGLFERIGKGRLDRHLNIEREDEIGQLARAFDRMIDNLKEVTASRNELNREIVERTRIESELRATSFQRKELESIVNHSPAVAFLWRIGKKWSMEFVSDNIAQFGYGADDLTSGKVKLLSLIHPEDLDGAVAEMQRRIEQGSDEQFSLEFRLIKHSGEVCWIDARLWLRRGETGEVTHFQGVMLDVSDRKMAEEQVRQLAFYDALTGLPNRALFINRLDQSLAQAERDGRSLALMYLDLDHFKEINDTFGHAAGDMVLQASAQRLNSCVRRNDTVARLGGDELVILLAGIEGHGQALTVAQKILKVMSVPFQVTSRQLMVTPSIGIVLFPEHGREPGELLKRADIAMYAAKEKGRNGYAMFSAGMEEVSKVVGVGMPAQAVRPLEPGKSGLPWEKGR
jgi:diguanylate cyclase (GGDEF)-like protein/PAS domain S-box-containing protein